MTLRDAIADWLTDRDVKYRAGESTNMIADGLIAAIRSYYSGHPERVSDEMVIESAAHDDACLGEVPDERDRESYRAYYKLHQTQLTCARRSLAAALSKVE